MFYKYFAPSRLKAFVVITLLWVVSLFLQFASGSLVAQTQPKPVYEVYALSYGVYPNFPVSGLLAGADKTRKIDLQMMVWLIKGANGKNILVDTGCYHENVVKGKGIQNLIKASDAIAKLGLSPTDITDVIITHMHWDHADGVDLFPNAQIWIQKDEYTYYTGAAWQPGGKHGGIEREDMQVLLAANMAGRLHLVDGDREIIPGIRVWLGGRHTWASQFVSVTSKSGTIVLASDNAYLYENLDKHLPIAQTFDAASNLAAQEHMKTLVKDPRFIVPGHDPAV